MNKRIIIIQNYLQIPYAGISLTGYHPPGHPGAFAPKCVPSPGLLHNRKCPGAGLINDDVPGAGHLHQST